jgi:dephospho-CoA kinase
MTRGIDEDHGMVQTGGGNASRVVSQENMRSLRVGLTGGIGAGKSAVAAAFRDRGATVIDADVLARAAVAPGSEGAREVAAAWPQVVDAAGTIDRPALAAIVFADPAARERLNAIVHPRVRAGAEALEQAAELGTIVVHDVPLLFEGDYWRSCDATVLVVAPVESRIARVMARDGIARAQVEERMRAQIDPAEARRRATFTIENDADLATLRARAGDVYDRLLALR